MTDVDEADVVAADDVGNLFSLATLEVGFPICWYLTLGSSQLVDLV